MVHPIPDGFRDLATACKPAGCVEVHVESSDYVALLGVLTIYKLLEAESKKPAENLPLSFVEQRVLLALLFRRCLHTVDAPRLGWRLKGVQPA